MTPSHGSVSATGARRLPRRARAGIAAVAVIVAATTLAWAQPAPVPGARAGAASSPASPPAPPDASAAAPADILVSRQLAESEGLAVGSVVRLSRTADGVNAQAFRVAGIYEPTPDPNRLGRVTHEARLHLPDLLDVTRTTDGTDHVDAVNVLLRDPSDAPAFAREVAARLPGLTARSTRDTAGGAGPFQVLERFHLAIAVVTILAATVFLLALTVMLVDERRETVGVLRLIGLPAHRIVLQVLIEGVLVAGGGAALGVLMAVASEVLINRFFQWRYDTALVFVEITPGVVARCIAIAVPLGVVSTVAASWALLRRNALRLARR